MSIAIIKWHRLDERPVDIWGVTAVSWPGLIVDAVTVSLGPHGLFVSLPRRRAGNGRWLKVVRFKTVREETEFKRVVLAALMKAYPEDFVGFD